MSDIVERLRAWVYTDSQYATAREAANEIERLRLTDAERNAITEASDFYVGTRTGSTLRGLLNRTLGPVASDEYDR